MRLLSALLAASTLLVSGSASAVTFNLIDLNGRVKGTAAEAGFRIASDYWASVLTNNVSIDVVIDYKALGTGVIGATQSNAITYSTAEVYQQLAASAGTPLDAVALANLQPLSDKGGVSMITPGYRNETLQTGVDWTKTVYDTDDTRNNTTVQLNTANAKALGFDFDNGGVDAGITFSSAFDFDFDPTDGISAGSMDFIGVAVHEMGHMLGFVSGVDAYDSPGSRQLFAQRATMMSTLDLFRYSDDPKGVVPGDGLALDMTPGTASFFSIDGKTKFNGDADFSTGNTHGDGQQASHWKDRFRSCGAQIGIMDPTFCRGQMGDVTKNDVAALDAIGWNTSVDTLNGTYNFTTADIYRRFAGVSAVPEPSTWSIMIVGVGLIGGAARRSRRPAVA